MKLHETVKNFYLKRIRPLFKIEVLSENGQWNRVESLNITDKSRFYKVVTKSHTLKCTDQHIVIDELGNEIFAKDSLGIKIRTTTGIEQVESVTCLNEEDNAYDLTLAQNTDHLYYANGILSHNCVFIDEMAFIPKNVINDFFASVMPVISSSKSSKAVVVSTPNGTDNLYYEIWQAANMRDQSRNKEGWVPFRIDWWEVPGRDDEWKEKQIATIGIERWRQEFNNEFLTSSFQKLVPDDILEYYRRCLGEWKAANVNQGYDAEILSSDENKRYRFKMWHSFNPDRTYVATADAADGTGGDYSVLQIWDVTNLSDIRLCCEFASAHVSTIEFAYIINEICKLYCSPFLIMESNGIGQAILEQLKVTYEYQNLTRLGKDGGYGVRSHMQVKSKACLWTREMLTTEGFGFEIYSKRLVDEMGAFVKKDTAVHVVYAALGKNSHDDFMMSFVWMAWMLSEENVERYFTVTEQFKSPLGKILPKTLQPQFEYTREEVVAARSARPTLMFEEWKEALKGNVGATPGLKYVPKEEPKQEPLPLNQPQRVDPFQQRREEIELEEEGRRHFAFAGGMGGGDEFGFGDGDWN